MKSQSHDETFPDPLARVDHELFESLAQSIRQGQRGVATAILRRLPDAMDCELALDLIYREIILLRELGEAPDLEHYRAKFPHLAARLDRLVEVDQALQDDLNPGLESNPSVLANDDETLSEGNRLPQRWIGKYELLDEIGRGASSRVFRAKRHDLDRIVAVKLLTNCSLDDGMLARFRREAALIASLQHPGIVQLFDYGNWNGRHYLVLEHVDGGNLRQRCREELGFDQIVQIMIRIGESLQHAHDRNIIHRDLKPSNVLLTNAGEPKISDFGLGKSLDLVDSANSTRHGTVIGTPSYMAPELARPGKGKHETRNHGKAIDVYGLGAIFYELLTGRPPFVSDSVVETIRQVVETEPTSPRLLRPHVPRDLEILCLRCLNKEPSGRFPSASHLVAELRRFRSGEPILSRPAGRLEKCVRWCRRKPVTAALLALLLLVFCLGIGGVLWQWRAANQQAVLAQEERNQAETNFIEAKNAIDNLTQLALELESVPHTQKIREQALREVLEFYNSFASQLENDRVRMEGLAQAYQRMGTIRVYLMDNRAAIDDLQRAAKLFRELVELHPNESQHLFWLGKNLFQQGTMYRNSQRHQESFEAFRESAQWYAMYAAANPDDRNKIRWANALGNTAASAMAIGDDEAGLRAITESRQVFEQITDKTDSKFLFEYGLLIESESMMKAANGDRKGAISGICQAIVLQEQSLADPDSGPGYLAYVARLYSTLARFQFDQSPRSDGQWRTTLEKSQQLFREYWKIRPDLPYSSIVYVDSLRLAAALCWKLEEHDQSREYFRAALDAMEVALGLHPTQEQLLSNFCQMLVGCPFEELRDPDRALRLSGQSLVSIPDSQQLLGTSILVEAMHGNPQIARDRLDGNPGLLSTELTFCISQLIDFRLGKQPSLMTTESPVGDDLQISDQFLIDRILELANEN